MHFFRGIIRVVKIVVHVDMGLEEDQFLESDQYRERTRIEGQWES